MYNFLKAEYLKQKRRFSLKLLWIAPLIPILLSLFLMGGRFLLESSFNWWYTMILPGTLSILVSFMVSTEKKHNRHGLFCVLTDKKKLWIAQLILSTLFLFFMNLIFFVFLSISGAFFGVPMPLLDSFLASLTLSLTFAWQIPLFMFLCEKTRVFFSIFASLFLNMSFGIFFAATKFWYVPFSIPARLMCPIIRVLPNGIPLPADNSLATPSVIVPGLLISIFLYLSLSFVTTSWFAHTEG